MGLSHVSVGVVVLLVVEGFVDASATAVVLVHSHQQKSVAFAWVVCVKASLELFS